MKEQETISALQFFTVATTHFTILESLFYTLHSVITASVDKLKDQLSLLKMCSMTTSFLTQTPAKLLYEPTGQSAHDHIFFLKKNLSLKCKCECECECKCV